MLASLGAVSSAPAQQGGWAPTVTPIDAKTQPLPKMRGAVPRNTPEPQPEASAKPPPLPFIEKRGAIRDPEAVTFPGPTPVRADGPTPPAEAPPPLETPLARGYCATIGTLAGDAKFAWQKKAIGELAADLESRTMRLEEKTKEYQVWLARRDEFAKKVTDNLVTIYSRMRAEAAGQQLMAMDEETAAAIIMKLDPRVSSAILNDMNPQNAARITSIISGAARTKATPAPPKPATPENRKS